MLTDVKLCPFTENTPYYVVNGVFTVFLSKTHSDKRFMVQASQNNGFYLFLTMRNRLCMRIESATVSLHREKMLCGFMQA